MANIAINVGLYLNTFPKEKVTVKKLKEWLELVEKFNIPDDTILDEAALSLYINVDPTKIDLIGCGDCMPFKNNNDLIITTHECTSKNKENDTQ